MKKLVSLTGLVMALAACVPYNNAYYGNRPGYYPSSYANQQMPYQNQPQYNKTASVISSYDEFSEMSGYGSDDILSESAYEELQASAIPVQQSYQQTVYQDMPENPAANQFAQPKTPYYNPNLALQQQAPAQNNMQYSNGVIGVGDSLDTVDPLNRNKDLKLVMPHAWRMAHPSIGKGLELANEAERLEFNRALNNVSVKAPADVFIGGKQATIIALEGNVTSNSRGFLCKNTYLVKANRDKVEKMWGKFCRHPNWNEWVLTSW
jgi:hypothetical protein